MNPAQRGRLGRTAIEVTRLGFGAAPLGGFRGTIAEHEVAAILQSAYDAGLNLYDTSPYYGYGRSELRTGHFLRQCPRERYVLSTKIGRVMEPLDRVSPPRDLRAGGLAFQPRFDYSADGALRSLEQSMLRLGLTDIDIVFIHDVDVFTHGSAEAADRRYAEALQGCYPALERLRDAGVVKAIGVGLNETERSLRFARDTDIDCLLLAGRYTLLEQDALDELLPTCVAKGIGVVIGGPYNSGALAAGPGEQASYDYGAVPERVARRVEALRALCERHAVSLTAAALQFPLAHPAVASVIPGAMSVAQQHANIASMQEPIAGDFWAAVRRSGLVRPDAPLPA